PEGPSQLPFVTAFGSLSSTSIPSHITPAALPFPAPCHIAQTTGSAASPDVVAPEQHQSSLTSSSSNQVPGAQAQAQDMPMSASGSMTNYDAAHVALLALPQDGSQRSLPSVTLTPASTSTSVFMPTIKPLEPPPPAAPAPQLFTFQAQAQVQAQSANTGAEASASVENVEADADGTEVSSSVGQPPAMENKNGASDSRVAKRAVSKKIPKMRTTNSTTARNLCAIDWCTRNVDGTAQAFKEYFDNLSQDEKKYWEQQSRTSSSVKQQK
ncbi:hypothetical protein H0H92_005265, partial [Tricholoma furcatifolium]